MSTLADVPASDVSGATLAGAAYDTDASLPLLRHYAAHDTIGWQGGRPVTAAQFAAAAAALARTLPAHATCMNVCGDRLNFALGIAAALMRNHPVLLPPNQAPDVLREIADGHAPVYCLTDQHGLSPCVPALSLAHWPPNVAAAAAPCRANAQAELLAFTSGSTGTPRAHRRNWLSYVQGARGLLARLPLNRGAVLLGTVPAQHMWGLEASVMLALQAGCAIHAATPLLPADVCHALAGIRGERWLVTTPLHLRALLRSRETLPPITGVLSATAALDAATAQAFEARTGAVVYEIYGTTETGALATRTPARTRTYRFLPGVSARPTDEWFAVQGGHVHQSVVVNDALRRIDDQHFELEGRVTDMVKIAGKRASLSALNLELLAITGVLDGVFFAPPAAAAQARLTAFVVAPGLTRSAIAAALRKRIDPAFVPRPLHLVSALPRNASGKITRDALLQLADGVRAVPAMEDADA